MLKNSLRCLRFLSLSIVQPFLHPSLRMGGLTPHNVAVIGGGGERLFLEREGLDYRRDCLEKIILQFDTIFIKRQK